MPRFVPSFLKNTNNESYDSPPSKQFPQINQPIQKQEPVQEQPPSRFGVSRFSRQDTVGLRQDTVSYPPVPVNEVVVEPERKSRFAVNNSNNNINRFEPLKRKGNTDEESDIPKKNIEEPRMKPMTMAELTSNTQAVKIDSDGFTTVGSKKKTFADKFKDKKRDEEFGPVKKLGLPMISLPKMDSFEEFPSLGGTPKSGTSSPKKTPTATSTLCDMGENSPVSTGIKQSTSSSSFANLAKGWAKKTEDEAIAAELERLRGEKEKQEEEAFRNNIRVFNKFGKKKQEDFFDDEDEAEYADEGGFEDEEDYEVPSGDEGLEPSDEDDSDYDPNYEQTPEKEYEERF